MSAKYIDFNEISNNINFIDLLNELNIPYQKKKGEFRGETENFKFIINIEKNLFFSPNNQSIKGSVINFLAEYEDLDLRDAALKLHERFLSTPKPRKREMPELELHYTKEVAEIGIEEATAKYYEIGMVKQKSIMNGRIAFKIYDNENKHIGYVGWSPQRQDWFFPKNFKRPLYNANNCKESDTIILTTDLFDCIHLIYMGYSYCCSLIGKSMTDRQFEILIGFDNIILLHPEPENIVNRLSKLTFVKAPEIVKSLKDYSAEEIVKLIG